MAKILGIELKAVKYSTGHEGERLFQANIYMDNKKIGTCEERDWGVGMEYAMEKQQGEFNRRVEEYFKKNPAKFDGPIFFLYALYELWDLEQIFKKKLPKTFEMLAVLDFRPAKKDILVTRESVKVYYVPNERQLVNLIQDEKPVSYKTYRSKEDFII